MFGAAMYGAAFGYGRTGDAVREAVLLPARCHGRLRWKLGGFIGGGQRSLGHTAMFIRRLARRTKTRSDSGQTDAHPKWPPEGSVVPGRTVPRLGPSDACDFLADCGHAFP